MRKTNNLAHVLKAVLLICTLCLLTTIQSNAQSNVYDIQSNSVSQTATVDAPHASGVFNLLNWVKRILGVDIVTPDMTVGGGEGMISNPESNRGIRIFNSDNPHIVTTDMSVRDGGN